MIVFDLKCGDHGHVFEAWFASSDSFEDQRARGLVHCPICGCTEVAKAVMAPAVPRKGNAGTEAIASAAHSGDNAEAKALLATLAAVQEKLLAGSEWVGKDFDSRARAMDAGEIAKETIHGEVTRDQAKALFEDGIGVTPLPFPVVPPEKRN